jgi:rod shape-determining protein MreB
VNQSPFKSINSVLPILKQASWPKLTSLVGIDLGTSRTRIWCDGKGVVIDEPSVIAINSQTNKVIAVGQEAAEMRGRVAPQIILHRPIMQGRLYDDQIAKAMLRIWLQKVLGWKYVFSPVVMVSVPAASSQASRQAVVELIYDLGTKEVFTIAQPLAAAIGAGVPIADASGTLIFQLGQGLVEAGLISLGSLIKSQSSTQAGDYLVSQLVLQIKKSYQLTVSKETAQQLMFTMLPLDPKEQTMMLVGQAVDTHAPQEIEVSIAKLTPAVKPIIDHYLQLIKDLLALVPPELTSDVLDKGMLLSGGLSQLAGLETWLTDQLGIGVAVVENPDKVVIQGIATALNHLAEYKHSLSYDQSY